VADIFAFLRSIPAVHLTLDELMRRDNGTESAEVTSSQQAQLHSSDGESVSLQKSREIQIRASSAKTTADGVYTTAQARNGKVQYIQHCAACHMASLSGNGKSPSLLGEAFSQLWNGHTVGELYDLTQSTMPQYNPRSLAPDQYINILAYLFQMNSLPAGREELKNEPNVLKDITISEEKSGRVGR
jgi:mono/diheme cytochrome c family protein